MKTILVEISYGELLDKISILEIKNCIMYIFFSITEVSIEILILFISILKGETIMKTINVFHI